MLKGCISIKRLCQYREDVSVLRGCISIKRVCQYREDVSVLRGCISVERGLATRNYLVNATMSARRVRRVLGRVQANVPNTTIGV